MEEVSIKKEYYLNKVPTMEHMLQLSLSEEKTRFAE
jgi:hypothetical protein